MNKKKILSLALVALLLATISFGTLAWFNDSKEVINTFYVADSDNNGTPNFSIKLYEQKVDENGNPIDNEYTEDGNTYHNILPGSVLVKNAAFRNTGDYDQWVRVHLTFSDSEVLQKAIRKAAQDKGVEFDEYVLKHLLTGLFAWECEPDYVRSFNYYGDDTMTYTFYYSKVVEPGQGIHVLKNVEIPGVLEQEDMNFGTDGFTLSIKAEAVQTANLGDGVDSASEAFAAVGWEIGVAYGE